MQKKVSVPFLYVTGVMRNLFSYGQ